MMQSSPDLSKTLALWLMLAIVLLSAFIGLYHLQEDSLWYDEGFTAYILHDDMPQPDGWRETARYLVDSALNMFNRARADVHPILYYGLMDGWTLIMGESVFVLRLPSLFFAMISLCATYALGNYLFDRRIALIAALILAVSHFFIYYSREARMYTLFMAIASLCMWTYLRWMHKPSMRRAIVYGLCMGLLLHTHYIGVFIIFAQIIHQVYHALRYRKVHLLRWIVPYVVGFIIFLPWMPFALEQLRSHPTGPLGQTVFPSEWGTVTWLWDIITSTHGGLYAVAFLLGGGLMLLIRQRDLQDKMLLLLLWFLVIPAALFAVNALGSAVLVVRYVLVILPALMLITAFGIRHLGTAPSLIDRLIRVGFKAAPTGLLFPAIGIVIIVWICLAQLTTYSYYWAEKPRWKDAIQEVAQTRTSLEPALVDFAPHNVATYYDRQYHLRRGISIDIGWRDFVPEELATIIEKLGSSASIWAILPSDSAKTWQALFILRQGREIAYRDTVQNMIFYRFDLAAEDNLAQVNFGYYIDGRGRILDYQTDIGHHWYANIGEEFCFDLRLAVLQDIAADYALEASLTQGFNTVRAQIRQALGTQSAGDEIRQNLCMELPADSPRGPYLLRLSLRDSFGVYAPVVESTQDLYFGHYLGVAWVSVDDASLSP